MAALRWILLGAGIALILGLWWWENRRARARLAADSAGPAIGERFVADDGVEDEAQALDTDEPVPAYVPTIERMRIPRRPPLIEIPEDLEVDISDFVGIDRRRGAEPEFTLEPDPGVDPDSDVAANEEAVFEDDVGTQDDHHRAPWVSTQPLERDEVAPRREEEPPELPPADPMERRTAEASKQRVVALRLVASGGAGQALRCARPSRRKTCTTALIRSFTANARTASRSCTSPA